MRIELTTHGLKTCQWTQAFKSLDGLREMDFFQTWENVFRKSAKILENATKVDAT